MDWMKDDGIFMPMLNDTGRNRFYKKALHRFANAQTVCDVGAGTGFLSVMAADYGAKHVIAVERDPDRYQYLNKIVQRLGRTDQIQVVLGDFLDLDIKADVYVSETINTQIFGEDMAKLSNHAFKHGGRFIPAGFRIWAEVYQDHPVFVLDLSENESNEYDPGINVDQNFKKLVNEDFSKQYSLEQTVYKANQLNRLFTLLPQFQDIKLTKLGSTEPVCVDLNNPVDESAVNIQVPFDLLNNQDRAMVVLKWQAFVDDITLNSDDCWFGNVAKPIRQKYRTQDSIVFSYNTFLRNWTLTY